MRLSTLLISATFLLALPPLQAVTPTPHVTPTATPTPTPTPLPTLHIAAAASLKDVMQELAKGYPAHLIFSFEASSILEKQIEAGAPADVFISADEAKMDTLQKAGLVLENSRHDLLTNNLVVVEADGTEGTQPFKSLLDFTLTTDSKIAIGQPDTVPAGVYAKAALVKAGVWDKIHAQIVPCENVRAALAAVEAGDARYGIIYQSDATVMKRAHIIYVVPADLTPKIVYPIACVRSPDSMPEVGLDFEKYLLSPAAATVFQKFGFVPIKPTAPVSQNSH